MSQPNIEAELMEATAIFWDKETASVRESILLACGYDIETSLDFSRVGFGALKTQVQRTVKSLIGEKLTDR